MSNIQIEIHRRNDVRGVDSDLSYVTVTKTVTTAGSDVSVRCQSRAVVVQLQRLADRSRCAVVRLGEFALILRGHRCAHSVTFDGSANDVVVVSSVESDEAVQGVAWAFSSVRIDASILNHRLSIFLGSILTVLQQHPVNPGSGDEQLFVICRAAQTDEGSQV